MIGERHPAQAHKVSQALPEDGLRDVRQVLLQVGVAGADKEDVREELFQFRSNPDETGDTEERVFRRLVSIGGRKEGGPLDVGIVVRATGGNANKIDPEVPQQGDELSRLLEIVQIGMRGIAAKGVLVRAVDFLWHAQAGRGLSIGQGIEGAQANCDLQIGNRSSDAVHDVTKKAGAVFKTSAVDSGAIPGTQEFVSKVAVAMFDVHEMVSAIPGQSRGINEVPNDAIRGYRTWVK